MLLESLYAMAIEFGDYMASLPVFMQIVVFGFMFSVLFKLIKIAHSQFNDLVDMFSY